MSNEQNVTRRTVIAGGCSLALVGCGSETGESNGVGAVVAAGAAVVVAKPLLALKMVTLAAPHIGRLLGKIGLTTLRDGANRIAWAGAKAERAIDIYDSAVFLNNLRTNMLDSSANSNVPKPTTPFDGADVNDFQSLPILSDKINLLFGLMNDEGRYFGDYDIIATIKSSFEAPPRTVNDVWGNGDLPHVRASPASQRSDYHNIDIGILPPGGYVSYSWRVPRGWEPTDDYIASNMLIGPVFLSLGNQDYTATADLEELTVKGRNVEALFDYSASVS